MYSAVSGSVRSVGVSGERDGGKGFGRVVVSSVFPGFSGGTYSRLKRKFMIFTLSREKNEKNNRKIDLVLMRTAAYFQFGI